MQQLRRVAINLLFAADIFILFFLVFEQRIVIPAWLQVLGRMHPLLLHFPIVLLLLAAFLEFTPRMKDIAGDVLLAGALTAALTVIMGLFLSREGGYESEALSWHKWTGTGIVALSSLLCWYKQRRMQKQLLSKAGAVLTAVCLLLAGHLGAGITHGDNFLLAPVTPVRTPVAVPLNKAMVYEHLVKPVLEEKCFGCHNASKAKGGLVMTTREKLLAGGKTGPLWVSGAPELSLLLQRIHLPAAEKKHMPPDGKPQLTAEEMQLLYYWVKAGAPFDKAVISLAATDSLRLLAAERLQPAAGASAPVYDFAAADEKTIRQLNNNYRVIYPVAMSSPALVVNFYNRDKYTAKALEELLPLKKQIVELHLQKMPVKDEDMRTILQFEQLRRLNLDFSSIQGNTLSELAALPHLQSLAISGTPVSYTQLQPLLKSKSLRELYLWNTHLTGKELDSLAKQHRQIAFIKGFTDDGGEPLKLTQPLADNYTPIFSGVTTIQLKHPVRGAEIRYTTDGSMPDSIHSNVFRPGMQLDSSAVIRAKAYKAGWYGSDVAEFSFYKTTYKPDSIVLLTAPAPKYSGNGGQTLVDMEKGDMDYGNGKWLGYQNGAMELLLTFREPQPVKNVTLSMLRNTGGWVFPPAMVEVWGGSSPAQLRLLNRCRPPMPGKSEPPGSIRIDCPFQTTNLGYIKIVAKPLPKLPGWHAAKGQKAWLFADEILVN
ncbi:MAG TPA: c-type cytochrome domain-containing protein [Chitinophaga sp.]|uniref:c-type cytochrome domain-containing protein n=1 Tax=Chitinophaga sp. TaxID=1869181 RepID=UPI002DB7888C|nr:c-type cytochrome domain-containing protein [Chitinophaga sp.]HEU4551664.1 c-type cytochrome domain-containing protein [Chitinophaga sp.]